MQLRPGLRLESATCDTQVVVVKAPKDVDDVDVRCGGAPMREIGTDGDRSVVAGEGEPTLLGKRYADDDLGLELLCTQGGSGWLAIGETPLLVKGAKPLPSSD
ncbi:MAG: hypothetical protein ABIY48_04415 [Acidimicrobiales bacterium]